MDKGNFSDDCTRDAAQQITERGDAVAERLQSLSVSDNALHPLNETCAESSEGIGLPKAHDRLEFGIIRKIDRRFMARGELRMFWHAALKRRGRRLQRQFYDSTYGSEAAALAAAQAWRDAMLAALPPITNREKQQTVRSSNRSGIPGVFLVSRMCRKRRIETWVASIDSTKNGNRAKRRQFSVQIHGFDRARELAIAQRQAWLADMHVSFLTQDSRAEEAALANFPDQLAAAAPTLPDEAEIEARIAAINARFDAERPDWLLVHLYQANTRPGRLASVVSDIGRTKGARLKTFREVSFVKRPLGEALALARDKIRDCIASLYDAETAEWFLEAQAANLSEEGFDLATGFWVRTIVPKSGPVAGPDSTVSRSSR